MANLRNLALFLGALLPGALAAPTPAEGLVEREVIPGKFIVTLKENVEASDFDSHVAWVNDVHKRSLNRRDTTGIEKEFHIGDSFNAYVGEFDEETIEAIRNSPEVSDIIKPGDGVAFHSLPTHICIPGSELTPEITGRRC